MRTEIKLDEAAVEAYAIIHTREITAQIRHAASILEAEINGEIITASENERIFILHPNEIQLVRTENEKSVVYANKGRYICKKRLYELEEALGKGFMRISKSSIVNLDMLECVEVSFGGAMLVILKNGCKDYISRKYLPSFKKYLGI